MRLNISRATLAALEAHARAIYPDECCGMIVERAGREEVIRISNVQNTLHKQDPVQFPRDARTAYSMDAKELLRVLNALDANELQLRAFYHSHPDHDAYFSDEDKQQALSWGEPSYPDAAQIVLSVRDGTVRTVKAFAWDAAARDFIEIALDSDS